jgi:capsular polysaccharide biosynthesis protein
MAETYTSRTLREIVRVVAGRFAGMIVILVVVLVAVGAATYFAPKWYRTEVRMIARPSGVVSPLAGQATATARDEVSLFVTTQREIILSDWVLATALMRLQGTQFPVTPGDANLSPSERERKLTEFTRELDGWDREVGKYVATHPEQMRDIRSRVEVVTPGGPDATFTQTFSIRVDWPEERDQAAKLSKDSASLAVQRVHDLSVLIKEAYLTRFAQLESKRTTDAARFIADESLAFVRSNLDAATKEFNDYINKELKGDLLGLINMLGKGAGAETGVATLSTQLQSDITRIDSRLAELTKLKEVVTAQVQEPQRKELQGILNEIVRLEETEASRQLTAEESKTLKDLLKKVEGFKIIVPDSVLMANPAMKLILDRIVATRLTINSLSPRYQDDYQELMNAKKELARVLMSLFVELQDQTQKITDEIAVQTARREPLAKKLTDDSARMDALAAKVARYERLRSDLTEAQANYDAAQRRVVDATTARKLASTSILVSVLDEPTRPDPQDPRRPVVWLNMLIAAIGGLILALVYAFMADHFDHTIKSIDDAERYLGTPVLASVPKLGRHIFRSS